MSPSVALTLILYLILRVPSLAPTLALNHHHHLIHALNFLRSIARTLTKKARAHALRRKLCFEDIVCGSHASSPTDKEGTCTGFTSMWRGLGSSQGTEVSRQGLEVRRQGIELSTQGIEVSTQGIEVAIAHCLIACGWRTATMPLRC